MLKPFSIIFYKGDSWISKIIKRFTNSEYSHVALVLHDSFHILETDFKTPVRIVHLSYSLPQYDAYELITPLTAEQKDKIIEFIKTELSAKYDIRYILSRWFNMMFGTRVFLNNEKYTCDRLLVDAFKHAGIDLVESISDLSPQKLSESKLLRKID